MNWKEAKKVLRVGGRVRRAHWQMTEPKKKKGGEPAEQPRPMAYLVSANVIRMAESLNASRRAPWLASPGDYEADDWEECEPDPEEEGEHRAPGEPDLSNVVAEKETRDAARAARTAAIAAAPRE